jgi:hypothetical protein
LRDKTEYSAGNGIAPLLRHVISEHEFTGLSLCKVRWPEKTPGVGWPCGGTGSFFLIFCFFFIKEKENDFVKTIVLENNPVGIIYL